MNYIVRFENCLLVTVKPRLVLASFVSLRKYMTPVLFLVQAIYPLSSLFSRSLKFPAKRDEILMHYRYFPHLSTYRPQTISDLGSRRIYLEFSLG